MEGFLKNHDFWALNAFVMAEFACHLERGFVGFQPGVAKEHVAHTGERHQLVSELLLQRDVVIVAAVHDFADLVLQGRHEFGVVVSQGVDRDARQCLEIAFTVGIPYIDTLSVMGRRP